MSSNALSTPPSYALVHLTMNQCIKGLVSHVLQHSLKGNIDADECDVWLKTLFAMKNLADSAEDFDLEETLKYYRERGYLSNRDSREQNNSTD